MSSALRWRLRIARLQDLATLSLFLSIKVRTAADPSFSIIKRGQQLPRFFHNKARSATAPRPLHDKVRETVSPEVSMIHLKDMTDMQLL